MTIEFSPEEQKIIKQALKERGLDTPHNRREAKKILAEIYYANLWEDMDSVIEYFPEEGK